MSRKALRKKFKQSRPRSVPSDFSRFLTVAVDLHTVMLLNAHGYCAKAYPSYDNEGNMHVVGDRVMLTQGTRPPIPAVVVLKQLQRREEPLFNDFTILVFKKVKK